MKILANPKENCIIDFRQTAKAPKGRKIVVDMLPGGVQKLVGAGRWELNQSYGGFVFSQNLSVSLMAEELTWAEIKQLFKETDAKFKETDAKFKETDKRIQQAFDLFESQWGRLMESLVEGDVVRILQEKGIQINRTSTRIKGNYQGTSYEFDIIAHNGKEIVVIEVKTTLRTKYVRQHIKKLQQVKTWLSEYHDYNVYGAVAFLRADENSEDMAEKRGLFVIRATGDSAAIVNAPGFEPRVF